MVTPTLLILAAGMGSRYGGLKLADPVGPGGEGILDYSIYDARRAGFGRFVFVIRREIEQPFHQMVCERFGKKLAVEYVYQELGKLPSRFPVPAGRSKPWGSTHAVLMASGTIREPFAVINVDDFYGAESYRMLARHLTSESTDYAMVGYVLRNTLSDFGSVPRGVCQVSSRGYLENILELKNIERHGGHAISIDAAGEETKLPGDSVVSMNMWGFTPHVFEQLREQFERYLKENGSDPKAECYLPITVNELLMSGKAQIKVLRTSDSWFGVTYPEDHSRAEEKIRHLIEGGYYPKSLW